MRTTVNAPNVNYFYATGVDTYAKCVVASRPMSAIERILERFGGLTRLAEALGHTNVTTVQGWKVRGSVPSRQIVAVIEAGKAKGIELTPNDFFDLEDGPDQTDESEGAAA